MEKKQTAVQWLYDRLKLSLPEEMKVLRGLVVVALEMEREQMKDAFVECWKSNVPDGVECKLNAEEYYNETYEEE